MGLAEDGIKVVIDYEKKHGRKPKDVHGRNFTGIDVISIDPNGDDHRTIEVKATKKDKGIPDAFGYEFTSNKTLIATFLYVVKFNSKKPVLYIIPKKEVDRYKRKHRITHHIKFASALKTHLEDYRAVN